MTDKTTAALNLAEEALLNTGNALMVISAGRNLRQLYGEMRDDAVERCNKALVAIREALAEQEKRAIVDSGSEVSSENEAQELVAWMWVCVDVESRSIETGLLFNRGADDENTDWTPLYAAPVDAKAIRAEALEQAEEIAKTIGGSFSVEFLAAIRVLK